MLSIVLAIVILGIIIFVHELGHFTFAKIFDVPVREFSIGMGKRLFSFVKGKTRYSIKVLPIGGSCALIGEDPAGSGDVKEIDGVIDEKNNTITFDDVTYDLDYIKKHNYGDINPFKKLLICFGGPLFNFLLALILAIVLVSFIGIDKPIIHEVSDNSSASIADPIPLQEGDEIIAMQVPGEKEKKISLIRDITLFMYVNDQDIIDKALPIKIKFLRDNKVYETALIPKYSEEYKKSLIGISLAPQQKLNGIIEHIKYGFSEFYFYIDSTIISLRMLTKGKMSVSDVSGPVGTVAVMGSTINEASHINILSTILTIFSLTILISANLGVMNLLPIPALDGGRIIFAIVEIIIGRRINPKVETFLNVCTMILLLIFMAWIFGLDIMKIVSNI